MMITSFSLLLILMSLLSLARRAKDSLRATQAPASHTVMHISYTDLHFPSSSVSSPICAMHLLDNRLQLSRIPQRILNDLVARNEDILAQVVIVLLREVYPAVLDNPARLLCEADDTAFRIEEEQGFGVGDGDGGVCALAAGSDFLADGSDEDLEVC